MARTEHVNATDANAVALPRLVLPPESAITPAELARRRQLYDEAQSLREEIGPIGVRTDELIRQVREEADAGSAR